ncbi:hypothetical protein RFI_37108 [Reticulomyxa filosa]|uniref:Uncharacterized protein n=1 Tax=Reticulomyxa filosa TaxID=46433 RepID=X6LFK0_RETFI|nr:hypothetical protein RFI_37108 [Reticulomyxa filosa]|eukprot:ETO00339.1 hypothetical protein RFI_37108 [Reticulomyxa filosa]
MTLFSIGPEFMTWLYEHPKEHFPDQWFEHYDRDKVCACIYTFVCVLRPFVLEMWDRLDCICHVICTQLKLEHCDELVREKLKRLVGMSLDSVAQQLDSKTIELDHRDNLHFRVEIYFDKYGQSWVLEYNQQPLLPLNRRWSINNKNKLYFNQEIAFGYNINFCFVFDHISKSHLLIPKIVLRIHIGSNFFSKHTSLQKKTFVTFLINRLANISIFVSIIYEKEIMINGILSKSNFSFLLCVQQYC